MGLSTPLAISLNQYIFLKATVLKAIFFKIQSRVIDIDLVCISHEYFLTPNKVYRLFNLLLSERKLFECITDYLEYTFRKHRVAVF